jgi:hypothetical protein
MWASDMRLDCDHLFADYFEPDATYLIKLVYDFPEGSLMLKCGAKMESCGITIMKAKLLLERMAGPFDMEEFVAKVVRPEANPTLLLLEWKPGFVVGGFASVAWPKDENLFGTYAADPEKKSFIFSLEPEWRRFDVLSADNALARFDVVWRSFKFGNDLSVFDDGTCWNKTCFYAGGREHGGFPLGSGYDRFRRFELWAL